MILKLIKTYLKIKFKDKKQYSSEYSHKIKKKLLQWFKTQF